MVTHSYRTWLHTLSFVSLTMSRYGIPGFTIRMSAPSFTSRSWRIGQGHHGVWLSGCGHVIVGRGHTIHRWWGGPTYNSSHGQPPGPWGKLVTLAVPKAWSRLCSISGWRGRGQVWQETGGGCVRGLRTVDM